jgi:hypothetical protein
MTVDVLHVRVVTPSEGLRLAMQSDRGDRDATELLGAISDTIRQIHTAPSHQPVCCMCCSLPVTSPRGAWFCIVALHIERPRSALGCVICPECAVDTTAARIEDALRGQWPDLRRIEIMPQEGHA